MRDGNGRQAGGGESLWLSAFLLAFGLAVLALVIALDRYDLAVLPIAAAEGSTAAG